MGLESVRATIWTISLGSTPRDDRPIRLGLLGYTDRSNLEVHLGEVTGGIYVSLLDHAWCQLLTRQGLNMTGFVWTVDQDTHHTVTVEFYDRELHRDFHFTDPYLYDKSCLSM